MAFLFLGLPEYSVSFSLMVMHYDPDRYMETYIQGLWGNYVVCTLAYKSSKSTPENRKGNYVIHNIYKIPLK